MEKLKYKELAKANIQEKRNIVISKVESTISTEEKGFTIAQQLEVEEGNKITNMYLKNAIHVDNLQGLFNLRDALNVAIRELTTGKVTETEDDDWD